MKKIIIFVSVFFIVFGIFYFIQHIRIQKVIERDLEEKRVMMLECESRGSVCNVLMISKAGFLETLFFGFVK